MKIGIILLILFLNVILIFSTPDSINLDFSQYDTELQKHAIKSVDQHHSRLKFMRVIKPFVITGSSFIFSLIIFFPWKMTKNGYNLRIKFIFIFALAIIGVNICNILLTLININVADPGKHNGKDVTNYILVYVSMSICAISCYLVLLSDTSFINSFKSILSSLNKAQLDISNLTNKLNDITNKLKDDKSSSDTINQPTNPSNKQFRDNESKKVPYNKSVLKTVSNSASTTSTIGGTTIKNSNNNTTKNNTINVIDNFPLNNDTEFKNAFSTLAIWNTLLLHSLNYMGIFFNKSIAIP